MLALDEQGVRWYCWFVLKFENVIVSFRAMHHNIIIAYSCVVNILYNDDGTRLLIVFLFPCKYGNGRCRVGFGRAESTLILLYPVFGGTGWCSIH